MARKRSYKVNPWIKSSKIVIAIAQIKGPLPDGKHPSLLGDRDTLVWKSSDDVKARINKACDIIDSLNSIPNKPNIIVFPEYSLPLQKALPRLQRKANEYKQILIPGADNIYDPETKRILNQCPIIIPNRSEPIWVTKRKLSQWEQGFVDEPEKSKVPILTWDVDGRTYWLSVYICLDFELIRDEVKTGGGVFIVPMCSPVVYAFHGWADNALRLDNGTATVLCNSVGSELCVGQSGVVAVVPGGKPFKAAFDLPDSKEAVAVFDIDCKQLAPPKKSNPDFQFPLGKRSFYSLRTETGRTSLSHLSDIPKPVDTRGVINPALFKYLGKTMRVAFLPVENYWDIEDKLQGQDFEVLAILGQQDILITHLGENREQMIYDVNRVINWRPANHGFKPGEELSNAIYDNFPFFRVDVFFKVLGVPLNYTHHFFSSESDLQVPSIEEAVKLMKLGSDWNDDTVSDVERAKFKKNDWILKKTNKEPGAINAIMTIYLHHETANIEHRRAILEDQVLPQIIKKDFVTSVYRGRAQGLEIHYVLRISANIDSLYALIKEIHEMASKSKVAIITTTYVVVSKLSNLSLEKAVLAPILPVDEKNYRDARITPRLTEEDRMRFIYLSEDLQRPLIRRFRQVEKSLREMNESRWPKGQLKELEQKLAKGMLHNDFILLKEPHDFLQIRVEKHIKDFIKNNVSEEQLDNWRSSLNIPSGRKKDGLSFTERIKLAVRYVEETGQYSWRSELLNSLGKTTKTRNALTHGDFERIDIDEYCDTLATYCRVLSRWDEQS